jgi:N-acetylglucosaminyldiphosphoundecaprenol N-acetyl-beta-D-mannosaminyltransferase
MKFLQTIGYTIFNDDLSAIPIKSDCCKVINTISPNSYGVATKDSEFESALKATDYLVLDGVYFAFASLLLQTFKNEFSDEDNALMVNKINHFQPDILFIGMTCPKQEKWAIKHRSSLNKCLVVCIGNVFDWFAGTQKPIHPFWFKMRLGWFIRIFVRPEVFKRNIGNQMLFFWHVILIFLKLKKYD